MKEGYVPSLADFEAMGHEMDKQTKTTASIGGHLVQGRMVKGQFVPDDPESVDGIVEGQIEAAGAFGRR